MTRSNNRHALHGVGRRRGSRLRLQLASVGAASALAVAILTGGVALAANITGTNGPDTINGTPEADNIQALDGNDTVNGRGGDDVIVGGPGRDNLAGDAGIDRIQGGTGNDDVSGGNGRDGLSGDEGNDTLDGGADDDFSLAGGDGNDTIFGRGGDDTLDGDEGADTLLGGVDDDTLFGLDGNDDLSGEAGDDELFGGPGLDVLKGGAGVDELEGEERADRIEGGGGDDNFDFNAGSFQPDSTFDGRDVVLDFQRAGQTGGDFVRLSGDEFAWVGEIDANPRIGANLPGGGDGVVQLGYIQRGDTFLVADSNDNGRLNGGDLTIEFRGLHDFTPDDFDNTDFVIAGTNGDDVITGTEGDDRIFAAGGNDRVLALGGNDEAHGGTGDDFLDGGPGGFDNLFGDEGNDELTLATSDSGGTAEGGEGDDLLFGSDFTSFSDLRGGAGNDDLRAGAAGSTLIGGSGLDRMVSGAANDQFAGHDDFGVLDNAQDLLVYTGPGRWSADEPGTDGDLVFGFQDGSDLFDLRGSGLQFSDLTILNEDFETTISSDRGTITIVEGCCGGEVFIDENDFLFA